MKLFYDLHLHSCLSPCGDEEMTPANLAGMCALAGLNVVALTDHNTAANCPAFCQAAQKLGLIALAGMELCTREEIHVICLFPTPQAAQPFSRYVQDRLPPIPNNPEIFGRQIHMGPEDRVLGEETKLLAAAADIGIDEACTLAARFGGLAYPAHIDRDSFSLLSVLGIWDPNLGFSLAELSRNAPPHFSQQPDLAGVGLLTGSDAHYLHQIPDARFALEADQSTPQGVLDALRRRSF